MILAQETKMTPPTYLHRNVIKKLLCKENLDLIIEATLNIALTEQGDLEFSEFQQNILQKIFHSFSYQFCTISTITLSSEGALLGLKTTNYNLPDDIVLNYLEYAHQDELAPLIYANPGRALNYTQVCRQERVKDHPFFVNHCQKYGIHHAISVGFLYPGHENTFITFDYMGDKDNDNWLPFNHTKVELATFPFLLAWLYRQGKFDLVTLEKYYLCLEDLTENKLLNLRKYINAPQQTLAKQAEDLGIQTGTLKDDLSSIRKKILGKMKFDVDKINNMPLRILDNYFGFLRMLGDHTASIQPGADLPNANMPVI